MPDRPRKKRPRDLNVLASEIVKIATEGESAVEPSDKNPHAVALGRLGGKKDGKAKAAKLTPEESKEIDRKAAKARWEEGYANNKAVRRPLSEKDYSLMILY